MPTTDTPQPAPVDRLPSSRVPLSPAAVLPAVSPGLCAGYLDVAIIVLKELCWNPEGYLLKWVIRDRVLAEAQPIYVARDR